VFEFKSPGADSLRLRADKVYATRHTIKPAAIKRATITGEMIAETPAGLSNCGDRCRM